MNAFLEKRLDLKESIRSRGGKSYSIVCLEQFSFTCLWVFGPSTLSEGLDSLPDEFWKDVLAIVFAPKDCLSK